MRIIGFLLLFGMTYCYAQQNDPTSSQAASCGPAHETFGVSVEKGHLSTTQMAPGKAAIYVIQDDTGFQYRPRPTTRIGVDGAWVGATHTNTFLYSLVGAGEHHMCAQWQGIGMQGKRAVLHFTATPGHSYYFRVTNTWIRDHGTKDLEFSAIDSDEGQLLASKGSLANSQPKK